MKQSDLEPLQLLLEVAFRSFVLVQGFCPCPRVLVPALPKEFLHKVEQPLSRVLEDHNPEDSLLDLCHYLNLVNENQGKIPKIKALNVAGAETAFKTVHLFS